MKKFLLAFCFFLFAVKGFSQKFSQYNTGTVFDSFENPAQRSFIPDSSKSYAFNFLIPNFYGDTYLTGNAQATLVNRLYGGKYQNSALQIGQGKFNNVNTDAAVYALMFKVFGSTKGDTEFGFFLQTKEEGRGVFSDESVALFNGSAAFPNTTYDNIFNDNFYDQVYSAIGLSYRERITNQCAIGFKLSFLMGVDYSKLNIYESHISFDNPNDAATISLRRKILPEHRSRKVLMPEVFLPSTEKPRGANQYRYILQNGRQRNHSGKILKTWDLSTGLPDLPIFSNFNASETINGLSTPAREDSIYNKIDAILKSGKTEGRYTTQTNSKIELSATKSYWVNSNMTIKYSPTLIASKELLYNGFIGALSNDFQYGKYHGNLSASYDNNNLFNLGLQFMFKTSNAEVYIGTEKLLQTTKFISAHSNYATYTNGPSTGASFFLGFTMRVRACCGA